MNIILINKYDCAIISNPKSNKIPKLNKEEVLYYIYHNKKLTKFYKYYKEGTRVTKTKKKKIF